MSAQSADIIRHDKWHVISRADNFIYLNYLGNILNYVQVFSLV